jgi:hypothetical protein
VNDDHDGPIISVEPGDPRNDQLLAKTRDDVRALMEITIHPLIDQAEAQNADLASALAALSKYFTLDVEHMPRERLASIMALVLFYLAETERMVGPDGRSVKIDD